MKAFGLKREKHGKNLKQKRRDIRTNTSLDCQPLNLYSIVSSQLVQQKTNCHSQYSQPSNILVALFLASMSLSLFPPKNLVLMYAKRERESQRDSNTTTTATSTIQLGYIYEIVSSEAQYTILYCFLSSVIAKRQDRERDRTGIHKQQQQQETRLCLSRANSRIKLLQEKEIDSFAMVFFSGAFTRSMFRSNWTKVRLEYRNHSVGFCLLCN